MKLTALIFSMVSLILMKHAEAALQEDTMDTWKTTISLNAPSAGYSSSGILKSHSGYSYTVNRNKTLFVTAPVGYSILVSIKYIDFRPANQDVLTLSAQDRSAQPVKYSNHDAYFRDKKYYPFERETYYVPSGNLIINFYTGPGYSSSLYDGFQLTYTVQGTWTLCRSQDFVCDNGRCISFILKCDNHNHCGDGSSDEKCPVFPGPGSGRVIGIASGSVFLVIAIACGIYVVCRRRYHSVERQTVITSHPPPPTNIPSYPPAYPYPSTNYPQPPPPYSHGVTNPGYH